MIIDNSPRLITCVLPNGSGLPLQRRLVRELGLTRVDTSSARGFIGSDPASIVNRVEKDIVSVVVDAEQVEEVFGWLCTDGDITEMEGRFLYVVRLAKGTQYTLPPDVPMEEGD